MRRALPWLLLFLVALVIVTPLFTQGCSCGHDFDFHLQSWLDAAAQFRHGTVFPRWTFSAAYNAGEPRFVFYPPLSWTVGAALSALVPFTTAPAIYTLIALTAAGAAMFHLARRFVPAPAAALAATLYAANPYMLFTAFERTAFAELLAAAFLPLLVAALLSARPRATAIAIPLALLWLTNAPAAVIGSYALAVLTAVLATREALQAKRLAAALPRLSATATGTALGLTLPAFFLLPALRDRRFVQLDMAVIPNMRFSDNFLFGHTGDIPHDQVLHTASLLAISLVLLAAITLALLARRHRDPSAQRGEENPFLPLAALAAVITFLLFPVSAVLWRHVPQLRFLQFPWRLLSLLAVVLALAIALLLRSWRATLPQAALLCLVIAAGATIWGIHGFRQPCAPEDAPATRATAFRAHEGVEATDEYTPKDADNDVIRSDDPPFWIAADPAAFAPGTTRNPGDTTPNEITAPGLPAPKAPAPLHLRFHAPANSFVILNLRAFPNWKVTTGDSNSLSLHDPELIPRDDGLLAVELLPYESDYNVDVSWQHGWDEELGAALTLCALAALLWLRRRQSLPA